MVISAALKKAQEKYYKKNKIAINKKRSAYQKKLMQAGRIALKIQG
jgi:hypothetical protein